MSSKGNRYEYWLSEHNARIKSGQSISEFCRCRRIKEPTYRKAMSRYAFTETTPNEMKRDFIELTTFTPPVTETDLPSAAYMMLAGLLLATGWRARNVGAL